MNKIQSSLQKKKIKTERKKRPKTRSWWPRYKIPWALIKVELYNNLQYISILNILDSGNSTGLNLIF